MLALTFVLILISCLIVFFPQAEKLVNRLEESSRFSECIFEKDIALSEGDYYTYELDQISSSFKININTTSGPPIELVIFDEENYSNWLRIVESGINDVALYGDNFIIGDEFEYEFGRQLGSKYLVLENTSLGKTYPPQDFTDDICFLNMKISKD